MKLPAGITTISGQSGQSRNTLPGPGPEVAAPDPVTVTRTQTEAKRISTDHILTARILFIGSDLADSLRIFKRVLSLSYNNAVSRVVIAVKR
jgi:hypothetical protein